MVVILGCFGCNKYRRVRLLEGNWKLEKVLQKDGSYTYPNESFDFVVSSKTKAKGTFAHYLFDQKDTLLGTFQILHRGVDFVMKNTTDTAVTYRIEDMDRESLIFRLQTDVYFLSKM